MSATATGSAGDELVGRLRESSIKMVDVARFLDDLSGEDRIQAIRSLAAKDQRRLYEVSDGFSAVRLVDIVPSSTSDLGIVRHYGKNSLPFFTEFEKRFSRAPGISPESPNELMGFNFQTMSPITGPGYFIATEDVKRGEVVVDYRRVPDCHPEGWPEIQGNERWVARLVYGFMIDTLRRVSEHVTIGSASRDGKDLGNWFVLCRES
jgi:hypothetical protein